MITYVLIGNVVYLFTMSYIWNAKGLANNIVKLLTFTVGVLNMWVLFHGL